MRRIIFTLLSFCLALLCMAQTDVESRMSRIRADSRYRWGEARSASYDEAKEAAREDLMHKLKTVLVSESSLVNDEFSNTTTSLTVATIENLEELMTQSGKDYVVMVYVSEADLRRAEEERKEMIADFVKQGISQEEQLNISEALKYYTWALRLLSTYQDKVNVKTPAGEKDAKTWLSSHIPGVLSNISISIPNEQISESPDDYDRYLVNIEATYDGRPVSMLDIGYFNGERMVSPVHCKSGRGVLPFHRLEGMNEVSIRVLYDFAQDGRNYSPTVASVYPKGYKRMNFDERASLRVPLKMKKDKMVKAESVPEVPAPRQSKSEAEAAQEDAAPIIKEPRKTIERPFSEKAQAYIDMMKRVEQAIRKRDTQSVRDCFTDEGFRLFQLMMGSGSVTVTKANPSYTVEESGNYIVGKSIPVAIKSSKHVSNEKIVFRFDPESGKIKSVAYALTQRAENDIFREASWGLDSRYALLQFMEDYQTAYALKRLDYIESIFSDNAIIITGTLSPKVRKRFYGPGEVSGLSLGNKVTYKKHTKDSYIARLKEDFRKNSFIQLIFEDTYISKVSNIEGLVNNDVIWIELNQCYKSSLYSDRGYLALQINMRPKGSEINVRTWTPYFIPIENLKKSFPIGY
ncbi:MAG: hypothetical protein HDS74_08730 [Bacteroidales bacterium]|nr:hypothetical protein [Bacteroidales bacterium]